MVNKLNILVAEKDPSLRSFICKIIDDEGHNSTEAEDGEDCIDQTKNNHFDAIFLDHIIPTTSDDEVLNVLRQEAEYNGTIVVFSGEDDVEMMRDYFKKGANAHVTKPVEHDVIKGVVKHIAEITETDY